MKTAQATTRIIIFLCIIALLTTGFFILSQTSVITFIADEVALKEWILQLGAVGPLAIISLITLAIIMSPIPSAPIALVAGAAYGHTFGTVYVITGAELGAIIAFFIARLVGVVVLQKWFGGRIPTKGMLGSQNSLMGLVFVSRLLPFISFDMISYAAGLTPLKFWRFAIATLAGIIPASFLLAHFGSELASGENQRTGIAVLLLGAIPLIFVLFKWRSTRRSQQ